MTDFPLAEITHKASILSSEGFAVHQKFTCAGCGKRVIRPEPNVFLPKGKCHRCNAVTDIGKIGCNYEVRIG